MTLGAAVWLAIPIMTWDLAAGGAGLVAEGDTLQWSYSTDPGAGPGPAEPVWATVPDGTYLNDADDSLRIDLPDLLGLSAPHLVLEQWVAARPGDRSTLEVDAGLGFAEVEPVGGYPSVDGFSGVDASSATWERVVLPLPSVNGGSVRLRLQANVLLADAGWYVRALSVVDGDVVEPVVTPVVEPSDTQDLVGPYEVEVAVFDDATLLDVQLHARQDGVDLAPIAMTETTPGQYIASLPAPEPASRTEITWWVEASDGEQVGRYPSSGEARFDVFLAAPTALVADVPFRFVGQVVPLTWEAPESPNAVVGYDVRSVTDAEGCADGDPTFASSSTPGIPWPITAGTLPCVDVVARYDMDGDDVLGEASEILAIDVEVPELLLVEPAQGYAGDTVWVEFAGASLYLDPGVPPDLGPDAEITAWDVLDAHRGRMQVAWASDAAVGPTDMQVWGLHGEAVFSDAFTVEDQADAPRILSVTPGTVSQGDEVDLVVVASEPFGATVNLDGGADVFLTAPAKVVGSRLVLPVSVTTRARLGERTLLVDDGERLWTVSLTVEEYRVPIQKRCATGPGAAGLGWCLGLVGLLRRRRSRGSSRG